MPTENAVEIAVLSSGEKVAPAGKISRSNSDSELNFRLPDGKGEAKGVRIDPSRIESGSGDEPRSQTKEIPGERVGNDTSRLETEVKSDEAAIRQSVGSPHTTDRPPESPGEGKMAEGAARSVLVQAEGAGSGLTALDSEAHGRRIIAGATHPQKPLPKEWTPLSDRTPGGSLNTVKDSSNGLESQSSPRRTGAGSIMDETLTPPTPVPLSGGTPPKRANPPRLTTPEWVYSGVPPKRGSLHFGAHLSISPPAEGLGVGSFQDSSHLRKTLANGPQTRVDSEVSSQPEEGPNDSNRFLSGVGKGVSSPLVPPTEKPLLNAQQSGDTRVAVQEEGIKSVQEERKVQFVAKREGAGSESEPQGEGHRNPRITTGKRASVASAGIWEVAAVATRNSRSAAVPSRSTQDPVTVQATRPERNHSPIEKPRATLREDLSIKGSEGQDKGNRILRELPSISARNSSLLDSEAHVQREIAGATRTSKPLSEGWTQLSNRTPGGSSSSAKHSVDGLGSQPEEGSNGSNRIWRRAGKEVSSPVIPPVGRPVVNAQQSGDTRVAVQEEGIKSVQKEGKVQFVAKREGAGTESELQREDHRVSRSSTGKTASVASAGIAEVTAVATRNPRSAAIASRSTQDPVTVQATRPERNHILTEKPGANLREDLSIKGWEGQDKGDRSFRELPSISARNSSLLDSEAHVLKEIAGATRTPRPLSEGWTQLSNQTPGGSSFSAKHSVDGLESQPEQGPNGSNRIRRRAGKGGVSAAMVPVGRPVVNAQQSGDTRVAIQEERIKSVQEEGKVQFVAKRESAGTESELQQEDHRVSRSSTGKRASVASVGVRDVTEVAVQETEDGRRREVRTDYRTGTDSKYFSPGGGRGHEIAQSRADNRGPAEMVRPIRQSMEKNLDVGTTPQRESRYRTGINKAQGETTEVAARSPRSAAVPSRSSQNPVTVPATRPERNHILTEKPRAKLRKDLPIASLDRSPKKDTSASALKAASLSTQSQVARGSSPASGLREGMLTVNQRGEVKNSVGELSVGKVAYEDERFLDVFSGTLRRGC